MALDMPDHTRWWRERPVETYNYQADTTLAAGNTLTVFDLVGHDIVIERLIVGTDKANLYLWLEPYTGAGVVQGSLRTIRETGFSVQGISPSELYDYPQELFDLLWYNTTTSYYLFAIDRPLRLAHGARLRFINLPPGLATFAYQIWVQDKGRIP